MHDVNSILRAKRLKPFDFSVIGDEHHREMLKKLFVTTQEHYHGLSERVGPDNHKPVLEVCITHPLSFDAFIASLQREDHFFVGLSYGVFANLFACFMGLLSHPDVLPHIGSSSITECNFTRAEGGLIDFTYETDAVKKRSPISLGLPIWNYPKDEDRFLYALLLVDIAYGFILYHEWGHLIHGHLGYSNMVLNRDELSELETDLPADRNNLETIQGEPIRKVMEFDADFVASAMTSSLAEHLSKGTRNFFFDYPETFLANVDIKDAILFSIMTMFHLFQEVRLKRGIREHSLYPSLFHRFLTLVDAIGIHADNPDSTWKNYNYQGLRDFARASEALGFEFLFDEIYDHDKIKPESRKLHLLRYELSKRIKRLGLRKY